MESSDPINPGMLEVYIGPMRSGKSGHLISRILKINDIPDAKYVAFKPIGDDRTPGKIYSRMDGGIFIPAIDIPDENPKKALDYICKDTDVIIFDETQFFSEGICSVVRGLCEQNKNIIVSGSNLDFRGEPFGMMPYFIAHANFLVQLYSSCEYKENDKNGNIIICGKPTVLTQRLIDGKPAPYNDPIKRTGDKEGVEDKSMSYEPRCRKHHIVPRET
jgi:thymidine kinase